MFNVNLSTNYKILLFIFIGLIVSIPALSFLIKQRVSFESGAANFNYDRTITQESSSSAKEVPATLPLADIANSTTPTTSSPSPAEDAGLSAQVNFGPTLNFKIVIDGRPSNKQGTKNVFVGLAAGDPATNPSYLLSFTVDVPDTGVYSGLSLAGLTINNTYTAYIKGPAQIASASAFVVRPNITELNSGSPLNLISGDLNEDNIVNTLDYNIAKGLLGKTSNSVGWNENADLNKDGVINLLDLAIIIKNLGKVGAGDVYTSHSATQSASIKSTNQGSIGGYWLWVPSLK